MGQKRSRADDETTHRPTFRLRSALQHASTVTESRSDQAIAMNEASHRSKMRKKGKAENGSQNGQLATASQTAAGAQPSTIIEIMVGSGVEMGKKAVQHEGKARKIHLDSFNAQNKKLKTKQKPGEETDSEDRAFETRHGKAGYTGYDEYWEAHKEWFRRSYYARSKLIWFVEGSRSKTVSRKRF
jgi:hypothetical protein